MALFMLRKEETLADDLISLNRTDDDTKLRTGCCILPLSEDGSEPSENVLKSKWVKRGVCFGFVLEERRGTFLKKW
jgi:hypothetical protein